MIHLNHPDQAKSFFEGIDTILFDCDGVLWHANHLLPDVDKTLNLLKRMDKKMIFVTNNSTMSRQMYVKQFHQFGLMFVTEDSIFCTAFAAAVYLNDGKNLPKDKKVFVVGPEGIAEELEECRIPFYAPPSESLHFIHDHSKLFIDHVEDPENIGAVLVGFDTDFSYNKMVLANYYLRHDQKDGTQCQFIASNTDCSYVSPRGIFPDNGAIVAAIKTACGREPVVLGKPNPIYLDLVIKKHNIDPNRTCMIGDRLDTDIKFGKVGKLKTLLALSGVSKESDLSSIFDSEKPDFYCKSVGFLGSLLN